MFTGSMVALSTPIKNGKIDFKSFEKLIDFQINGGIDVLVPCGTTGEAATMSHEEHGDVMKFVVGYVNKRVPVVCGSGSNSTAEAIRLSTKAKDAGADGVLVVSPYYNKPTQEGIFRHYEALTKAVDIPMIAYNVPGRTGTSIKPQTVARLAELKNIVGIKEASGSVEQVSQILGLCDITVISGDDALTLPMISVGAKGVISVVANIAPDKVSKLVKYALDGDFEGAKRLHFELLALSKAMFIETNPIPVKTALALMGIFEKEEFRLPLCALKEENKKLLKDLLKQKGLLK